MKKSFVPLDDEFVSHQGMLPVRFDTEVPTEVVERRDKPKNIRSSIEHKGNSVTIRLSTFPSFARRGEGELAKTIGLVLVRALVLGFFLGFDLLLFYCAYSGLRSAWRELVGGEKWENGNPWAGLLLGVFFVWLGCAVWHPVVLRCLRRTSVLVTPSLLVFENRWLRG